MLNSKPACVYDSEQLKFDGIYSIAITFHSVLSPIVKWTSYQKYWIWCFSSNPFGICQFYFIFLSAKKTKWSIVVDSTFANRLPNTKSDLIVWVRLPTFRIISIRLEMNFMRTSCGCDCAQNADFCFDRKVHLSWHIEKHKQKIIHCKWNWNYLYASNTIRMSTSTFELRFFLFHRFYDFFLLFSSLHFRSHSGIEG